MSWLKRLLGHVPSFDIPPEREEELVEKIVNIVSRYGMEDAFLLFGGGLVYTSTFVAQTMLVPMATFLEFWGISIYDYVALLNKRENAKKIVDRLEALREAREQKEG